MPKELIQRPTDDWNTEMSVHWSKEQSHVQIGLTRHARSIVDSDAICSPMHGDHHACHECAVAVERNKDAKQGWTFGSIGSDAPPIGEFDPPATVFTKPMTRSEINELIRILRRARDQAHGQDA